ncbi:hypothetical protein HO173_008087 [Letharia columbiana]|uniref:Uncharacterized protein n=1 Tax=Letharia columbiana TaxID=112416 RepID=A0A8H6L380_9LECA|nr:uncharacterized protein HO173_008087 [Letharia columbiana]KAF6233875.1 hypothetical protein HO173_008087 [Letharia columbiana]
MHRTWKELDTLTDFSLKSVLGYWNQLVWNFYGEGNPTCNKLESQAESPHFHGFCIKRGLLEDTWERDEADRGFRPSGRKVTPSENKRWPGVLIMETCPDLTTVTKDHREFLIPLIGLRALKHVLYKNFVRSVLEANLGLEITYSDMQLLWDAIVHKSYHFVCTCERKAKVMELCT